MLSAFPSEVSQRVDEETVLYIGNAKLFQRGGRLKG